LFATSHRDAAAAKGATFAIADCCNFPYKEFSQQSGGNFGPGGVIALDRRLLANVAKPKRKAAKERNRKQQRSKEIAAKEHFESVTGKQVLK
jgi:hypothetical protein